MSFESLHKILHPESVVIAGASNNPVKMGAVQAMNVMGNGFRGEVVFIHPRDKTVLGRPAYRDPMELPFVPDLALLITPTLPTPDLLDSLGQRGVRQAIVTTAGFKEVGPDGASLQHKLMEAAHRHGIRFVGPNCIGVLNTHHPLNTTILPQLTAPGPLSLVSQSGTFVAQLPVLLERRGVRLGKGISVGNSADTDIVDWLEYLGQDPLTKAIMLYIEGLSDARRFLEVASRVTRVKPVVAVYVGGSEAGARAGMGHTASMGGPSKLYDGLFAQSGVLRATTIEEMIDWGWALAVSPRATGDRVGILTNSGGPSTCMADEAARLGLKVPVFSQSLQDEISPLMPEHAPRANPVDLTFFLNQQVFTEEIPEKILSSGEVDMLLVHGIMDSGMLRPLLKVVEKLLPIPPQAIIDRFKADLSPFLNLVKSHGKPVVATTYVWDDDAAQTLRDNDIPLLPCAHRAARTLATLLKYSAILERPLREPHGSLDPVELPELRQQGPVSARTALSEDVSRSILQRAGVRFPNQSVVNTLAEATTAAARLGYPVVLKGIPDGVAHKTEAGLVHLDLRNNSEVEEAFNSVRSAFPEAKCLVAKMVKGRRELVVGMTRFPGFGPAIMLGSGGVFTEALSDTAFRMAPLALTDGSEMLAALRSAAVFGNTRGLKAVNQQQLASVLEGISRLALAHPEIAEIDINPLVVDADGNLTAVDALVVLDK